MNQAGGRQGVVLEDCPLQHFTPRTKLLHINLKRKAKRDVGTSRGAERGSGAGGQRCLRPQMAKRARSGFRFRLRFGSEAIKGEKLCQLCESKHRQKVNINIHLVAEQGKRGGRGEAGQAGKSRAARLTMARQMPSKLKMRRKT